MSDSPVNTNVARDIVDRLERVFGADVRPHAAISPSDIEYLSRALAELDWTRTERNMARQSPQPQSVDNAPYNSPLLVWWPIVQLDEWTDLTEVEPGGAWLVLERQGVEGADFWLEPEVLNACGDQMGDDHAYAWVPRLWLPLPGKPKVLSPQAEAKGEEDAGS